MRDGESTEGVDIPGTWNARDIGEDHRDAVNQLRSGVAFRSASLAHLTAIGRRVIDDLGIRTIIDLRSDEEVLRDGADQVPDDATVLRLPFGGMAGSSEATADLVTLTSRKGDDRSADHGKQLMMEVYRQFVTDEQTRTNIGVAIRAIADTTGGFLVHCSAGKDRTGWMVAVLQAMCSVDRQQIDQEYLRSGAAESSLRDAMPTIPGVPDSVVHAFFSVDIDYLNAARSELRKKFGTLDSYLSATGIGANDVEKVRTRLLANAA